MWILFTIIIGASDRSSQATAEFANQQQCVAAAEAWQRQAIAAVNDNYSHRIGIRTLCMPKGDAK